MIFFIHWKTHEVSTKGPLTLSASVTGSALTGPTSLGKGEQSSRECRHETECPHWVVITNISQTQALDFILTGDLSRDADHQQISDSTHLSLF